jgi:hypothetical protein
LIVDGNNLLKRIIRLICTADWTSFYLGIINGINPNEIPIISELKKM